MFPMDPNSPRPHSEVNTFRKPKDTTLRDQGYIAWLERHRYAPANAFLDMDAPDPRDVAAIDDLNEGITETVDHFAAAWMTPAGEAHARIILADYFNN